MEMRLEKYLISCGIDTGKKIKERIRAGEITVDGEIETDIGIHINPETQKVLHLGKELSVKSFRYYVFNKPAGYLTAVSNPINDKPTVMDVLPKWIDTQGLAPVGRLDRDTEGLLIFTNDGEFNHFLTHPDKTIEKTYYAELIRDITDDEISKLEMEIEFHGYHFKPGKAKRVSENSIHLTITEGKYHQVKKMLRAVGNKVVYLKRIKFGNLTLGEMKLGEAIEVTKGDIF
ncbi:MAG: pseudouridine synthase [Fusobacteriaceae bacterium]